jgi:flavin-dependent dehydrogenase
MPRQTHRLQGWPLGLDDNPEVMPGVRGALNLEHRILCQVLNEEAEAAGALLLRSVGRSEFKGGLSYSRNDKAFELQARVVVGADGRNSTIARQAGVKHTRSNHLLYLTGLLVDQMSSWPEDEQTIAVDDGLTFYVFPQEHGRARLYVAHPKRFS